MLLWPLISFSSKCIRRESACVFIYWKSVKCTMYVDMDMGEIRRILMICNIASIHTHTYDEMCATAVATRNELIIWSIRQWYFQTATVLSENFSISTWSSERFTSISYASILCVCGCTRWAVIRSSQLKYITMMVQATKATTTIVMAAIKQSLKCVCCKLFCCCRTHMPIVVYLQRRITAFTLLFFFWNSPPYSPSKCTSANTK